MQRSSSVHILVQGQKRAGSFCHHVVVVAVRSVRNREGLHSRLTSLDSSHYRLRKMLSGPVVVVSAAVVVVLCTKPYRYNPYSIVQRTFQRDPPLHTPVHVHSAGLEKRDL